MTARGSAFLVLWNHFDASLLEEYECWHTFEHVPERLSVPGFLSARRYATGTGSARRYFTLYEIDTLDTLESAAYAELVDRPSGWSERMRRFFSGFQRFPCRSLAQGGSGLAGVAATVVMPLEADGTIKELTASLSAALARGVITAYQVGTSIPNPHYEVFEQQFSHVGTSSVAVLVLEATTHSALEEARSELGEKLSAFQDAAAENWQSFDLLFSIDKSELSPAGEWRFEPREDLRVRFNGR